MSVIEEAEIVEAVAEQAVAEQAVVEQAGKLGQPMVWNRLNVKKSRLISSSVRNEQLI
ncbi:MAG: hypothetical protein HQ527_11025 [Cyanobacteria bacterium]|nr:hypothetical protein [Cyanobacteria bacterium bin.51]